MPKSDLPTTVTVGPYRYTVTVDTDAMNSVCRTERSDLLGHCDHKALAIHIEPTQAPQMMADTLLHETLHAITDLTGIAAELGSEQDESIVRRLSPALLDTLQRNPQLVAYLATVAA